MKTQCKTTDFFKHPLNCGANSLATDLLPYVDKPRLRRAVGSAAVAGGLLVGAGSARAQTAPPSFLLRSIDSPRQMSLRASQNSTPHLVDVDGDGDLDLIQFFRGESVSVPRLIENVGTPAAPRFKAPGPAPELAGQEPEFKGVLADFDGDGDTDKAYLDAGVYFENIGTSTEPEFAQRLGADNPLTDLGFLPIAARLYRYCHSPVRSSQSLFRY